MSAILGETDHGLSNAEIERVLEASKLADPRIEAEAQARAPIPLVTTKTIMSAALWQSLSDDEPLNLLARWRSHRRRLYVECCQCYLHQ